MNNSPTYKECASNWNLWCEYIDANATMTYDEWDSMSMTERIELIQDWFGPEEVEEVEE